MDNTNSIINNINNINNDFQNEYQFLQDALKKLCVSLAYKDIPESHMDFFIALKDELRSNINAYIRHPAGNTHHKIIIQIDYRIYDEMPDGFVIKEILKDTAIELLSFSCSPNFFLTRQPAFELSCSFRISN